MRGAGKMSSRGQCLPPPSTPRRRTCGCAALPLRDPPRGSRRLAELSTLPTTTSSCFLREWVLSASLSLTHEPRLPGQGASGLSSVTVNAAPGATGNLRTRWIQCPATRKGGGGAGSAAPFASRDQLAPNRCSQRTAGGAPPWALPGPGSLRAARKTWGSASYSGTFVSAVKNKQATVKWTFHQCSISHTLNFWARRLHS